MSKKNKLTPNQDKYKELQRRLKRKLRDVKKRGFTPNRAMREEWTNPELPKGITKRQIERLKSVLENIYDYVRYYNPLTDQYISGTERRKQERSESSRKSWETRRENIRKAKEERDRFWEDYYDEYEPDEYWDSLPDEGDLILNQVEEMIANWDADPRWSPELAEIKREDKNLLQSVIDGAIAEQGRTQVAKNINDNSGEFLQLVNQILYESGDKFKRSGREGVQYAIQRVRDIVYGRASTVRESIELTELAEKLNESE